MSCERQEPATICFRRELASRVPCERSMFPSSVAEALAKLVAESNVARRVNQRSGHAKAWCRRSIVVRCFGCGELGFRSSPHLARWGPRLQCGRRCKPVLDEREVVREREFRPLRMPVDFPRPLSCFPTTCWISGLSVVSCAATLCGPNEVQGVGPTVKDVANIAAAMKTGKRRRGDAKCVMS